ncbi:hypothetical protein [Desulfovibrio litoralis]|uniref:Uncharacterized protein n=1 Tax=Desulfovibrio litoralis DSM 11393 TaxID=1121455 RepID=A0A1M7T2W4_9BACT|nr:hypothetical protein [Desulfovibrio litoralis]SHN65002.1 hypothetical protein SAMN02745728_01482 [Desulfovibrio litoralis DSM 11393]
MKNTNQLVFYRSVFYLYIASILFIGISLFMSFHSFGNSSILFLILEFIILCWFIKFPYLGWICLKKQQQWGFLDYTELCNKLSSSSIKSEKADLKSCIWIVSKRTTKALITFIVASIAYIVYFVLDENQITLYYDTLIFCIIIILFLYSLFQFIISLVESF